MVVVVVMINSWILDVFEGFPGDSVVKNPPADAGDAGGEEPLEKEIAEEPGSLQSIGSQRVRYN